MTRRSVTDEQYGRLTRRVGELVRRTDEGTLPYDSVMSRLQALIEGGLALNVEAFPTWKNVRLGVHETADEYRRAMKARGIVPEHFAKFCSDIPCVKVEHEIELIKVCVADLRLCSPSIQSIRLYEMSDLTHRVRDLGLDWAPAEVVLALSVEWNMEPELPTRFVGTQIGSEFRLYRLWTGLNQPVIDYQTRGEYAITCMDEIVVVRKRA